MFSIIVSLTVFLFLTADDTKEVETNALKDVADYLQKHWEGKICSSNLKF